MIKVLSRVVSRLSVCPDFVSKKTKVCKDYSNIYRMTYGKRSEIQLLSTSTFLIILTQINQTTQFWYLLTEYPVCLKQLQLLLLCVLFQVPDRIDEWKQIQKSFECKWNFPDCCGALDGKHIRIQRPPNSTSLFYNYKGTYSIVLFVMVDAEYCFRYIDVGCDGRSNDSTIYNNSTLKIALERNLLNWPIGGLCVADDAFGLTSYMLKPYSHRGLSVEEKIFNYRLSRARRVAENAFGILASRFRIFSRPIPLDVNTVEILVKASCVLHNWLRMTSSQTYLTPGSVDEEDLMTGLINPGEWRQDPNTMSPLQRLYASNNYKQEGNDLREWFTQQFTTTLAVPWQMKSIGHE